MKNILVLFGGNSSEHLISCHSAKSILENIDKKRFNVISVGISKQNEWYVFNNELSHLLDGTWLDVSKENKLENIISFITKFDVVFPIIHGTNGEDGKIQGLLDLFNIKYVGSNTLSSVIGMDKEFSKIVFNYLNIPQVPHIVLTDRSFKVKYIEQILEYPVIVKPANGGSSIGISIANNRKELFKAIKEACIYDKKVIVEKFIKARELECAILEENKIIVSSIGEIKLNSSFYDYDSKYNNKETITIIPAKLPKKIIKQIQSYAKKAFIGINAKGIARVDFFYDEENDQIYLNEINTLPGFTTISMYPKLLMHDGISYKQIITTLINNAYYHD